MLSNRKKFHINLQLVRIQNTKRKSNLVINSFLILNLAINPISFNKLGDTKVFIFSPT